MAEFISIMQKIWTEGFGINLPVYEFNFSFRAIFIWALLGHLIFGAIGWLLFHN